MGAYLACAGFFAGVALASFVSFGVALVGFLILLAACLALLAALSPHSRRFLLLAALVLVACALGALRMHAASDLRDPSLDARLGSDVAIEGVIAEDPDVRARSVLLTIAADSLTVASTSEMVHARVLVTAPAYSEFSYGDRVRITGVISYPAAFETDTGRQFDYPGYLAAEGIVYEIPEDPRIEVIAHGEGDPVFAALFRMKHVYLSGLAQALPEPASALAGGITVGDKRSLGDDLLDEFRMAGVVHIVVLSGYNVTIIAETLLKAFAFLPLRFGLSMSALSIALFAILTGGAASIVRASIMAILALVARSLNRTYAITRALALAVLGMVAWNPFVLVHDPGFELSVLATIGLVFVSPLIEARARWVPEWLGMREVFAATLGTQATVFPFILYEMGTLSLVALPVNILILAAVPSAMLFSAIAALAGVLSPVIAPLIGLPAYALLSYILAVVHASVSLPFAALSLPPFPAWLMLVSYVVLFAFVWRLRNKPQPGQSLAAA